MAVSEPKTLADLARGDSFRDTTFVLRVNDGLDAGVAKILEPSRAGRLVVGKSPVCDLVLTDPLASRRHFALRREEHAFRFTDLGSTNGTRINGVFVGEALVVGGETIAVGGTTLRLTRAGGSPTPALGERRSFGRFIGASDAIREAYPAWERAAKTTQSIVIEGETGTGKELLAEAIHEAGERASGPFVVVDCASANASELSEAFDRATGGTLLLDEPSELGASEQAMLASLLGRDERIGKGGALDVRFIATSRSDLERAVQEGRFREELLYRLAAVSIHVPPLRERAGDVDVLARHFWTALGAAGEPPIELLARMSTASWPGNARQLRNEIAARLDAGGGDHAAPGSVPSPTAHPTSEPDIVSRIISSGETFVVARRTMLREFERRFVEHTLAAHDGNVSRAAAASGLARRYFQILRARDR